MTTDTIPIPVILTPPLRCKRCKFWNYLPAGIHVRNAEENGVRLWGECSEPEQRRFLQRSCQSQKHPMCYFTESNYNCGEGIIVQDETEQFSIIKEVNEEREIWGE